MNKKINDNDIIKNMTVYQLSRWLALFEGVNIVADKASKNGKVFELMSIKQPALEDYVDHTSGLIYRELINNKGE